MLWKSARGPWQSVRASRKVSGVDSFIVVMQLASTMCRRNINYVFAMRLFSSHFHTPALALSSLLGTSSDSLKTRREAPQEKSKEFPLSFSSAARQTTNERKMRLLDGKSTINLPFSSRTIAGESRDERRFLPKWEDDLREERVERKMDSGRNLLFVAFAQ